MLLREAHHTSEGFIEVARDEAMDEDQSIFKVSDPEV
jgi:hypothetical protein